MDFATKLRVIRVMLNWHQWQMAEALNVKEKTVSAWETAGRQPHPSTQRLLDIIAERNGLIFNERGYPEYADAK